MSTPLLPLRRRLHAFVLATVLAVTSISPAAAAPAAQPAGPTYLPLVTRNGSPAQDLTVTPDNARAVSAVIPPQGGTLVANTANGAKFTLTIPANTLAVTTTVTMTPVATIAGLPSPQLFAAVDIAPADALLFEVATLRLDLPAKPTVAQELGFGFLAGGRDYHRTPILLDRPEIVFPVTSFHGYGLARRTAAATAAVPGAAAVGADSDSAANVAAPAAGAGTDPATQLAQQIADLLHAERLRLQSGQPGDPQLTERLTAITSQFYTQVIAPRLAGMAADCDFARANIAYVLKWIANITFVGLEAAFTAQTQAAVAAAVAGLERCLDEAVQPCMDWSDPEQVSEVLSAMRQLELLGVEHSRDEFAKCQDVHVELNGQQLRSFALTQDPESGWETKAHFYFTDETVSSVSFFNPFRPFLDSAKADVQVRMLIGGEWFTDVFGGNFFCRDQKAQRVQEMIVSISDVSGEPPNFTPQLVTDNVGCWKWQGTSSWTVEHTLPSVDWTESGSVEMTYERKRDILSYYWNNAENKLTVAQMPYKILPQGKVEYQMDYTAYTNDDIFCSASITVNRTQLETANPNSDHLQLNNAHLYEPGYFRRGVDDIVIDQAYSGNCDSFQTLEMLSGYFGPGGTTNEPRVSANGKSMQGQQDGLLGEGSGTWTRTWNFVALREN